MHPSTKKHFIFNENLFQWGRLKVEEQCCEKFNFFWGGGGLRDNYSETWIALLATLKFVTYGETK